MQQYSAQWWAAVLDKWNASSEADQMARLGTTSFAVLDSSLPAVAIHWDERGQGHLLPSGTSAPLRFEATASDWRAFIDGEFNAAMGVLTRRIRLIGNPVAVLPYTAAFNQLAKVSRYA